MIIDGRDLKEDMKYINKKDALTTPVLLGYPREDCPGWKVWCPHCRKWHYHGTGVGHRCAHCARKDSPFDETGYFIVPAEADKKVKVRPYPQRSF